MAILFNIHAVFVMTSSIDIDLTKRIQWLQLSTYNAYHLSSAFLHKPVLAIQPMTSRALDSVLAPCRLHMVQKQEQGNVRRYDIQIDLAHVELSLDAETKKVLVDEIVPAFLNVPMPSWHHEVRHLKGACHSFVLLRTDLVEAEIFGFMFDSVSFCFVSDGPDRPL
jgi:hypothetical protein